MQSRCPSVAKLEALACLEQARDFYTSALFANVAAARPLQLYYCFLNLAKAFALTSAMATTFDRAQHGLSERLDPGGRELFGAYHQVSPSGAGGTRQIFADFYRAIAGSAMPAALTRLNLPILLPQILPGHRLWTSAANRTERFISLDEVRLYQDASARSLWLSLFLYRDDPPSSSTTSARQSAPSQTAGRPASGSWPTRPTAVARARRSGVKIGFTCSARSASRNWMGSSGSRAGQATGRSQPLRIGASSPPPPNERELAVVGLPKQLIYVGRAAVARRADSGASLSVNAPPRFGVQA